VENLPVIFHIVSQMPDYMINRFDRRGEQIEILPGQLEGVSEETGKSPRQSPVQPPGRAGQKDHPRNIA